MSAVIDASVAIKWVIEEQGHPAALKLIDRRRPPVAPHFALVECANVPWKKTSRGKLDDAQARDGLDFISKAYVSLIPDGDILHEAFAVAVELSHPVYDCLHLACAIRLGSDLITDDKRFLNKLGGTRFAARAKRFESAS